jgi:DDE superfamily endonuclease
MSKQHPHRVLSDRTGTTPIQEIIGSNKNFCVTGINTPEQIVVGGSTDTVEALCSRLSRQCIRAQGYLKLPNARALFGQSHGYKSHRTLIIFCRARHSPRQVKAGHNLRKRREFLHFMNSVIKDHPGKEIHVILDNLNTDKSKHDLWLKHHPNVHFHLTPTGASWPNLVEVWFTILSRAALKGASFTSPQQVWMPLAGLSLLTIKMLVLFSGGRIGKP